MDRVRFDYITTKKQKPLYNLWQCSKYLCFVTFPYPGPTLSTFGDGVLDHMPIMHYHLHWKGQMPKNMKQTVLKLSWYLENYFTYNLWKTICFSEIDIINATSLSYHNCHIDVCHSANRTMINLSYSYIKWRHDMETFSALVAHCEGNPLVSKGFPPQGRWILHFWRPKLNWWKTDRGAGYSGHYKAYATSV